MKILTLFVLFSVLFVGVQDVYFTNVHVYVNGVQSDVVPSGATVKITGKLVDTETPCDSVVVKFLWNNTAKIVKLNPDGSFTITFKAPDWSEYGWCGKTENIVSVSANDPEYYWVKFVVKATCVCPAQPKPKLSVSIVNIYDKVLMSVFSETLSLIYDITSTLQ